MKRRQLLSGISALLISGCLSDIPDEDDDTVEGQPDIGVGSVDSTPSDVPMEMDVSVTRGHATEQNPPEVEISVTNTGEEYLPLILGPSIFSPSRDGNDVFLSGIDPVNGTAYEDESDCWTSSGPAYFSRESRSIFEPGESRTAIRDVYTYDGSDSCYPEGTYRQEDSYRVMSLEGTGGEPDFGDETVAEFTWGFELEVYG